MDSHLLQLAEKTCRTLLSRRMTVSVAESCTGGMIGAALTAVPGSSACFSGGVIAYADEVKKNVLGVPARVLDRHGAVSAGTVTAMARNVRLLMKTDYGVAVSGIAGPAGGTARKPVGLVYVGISSGAVTRSFRYRFDGGRQKVRSETVAAALGRLLKMIG